MTETLTALPRVRPVPSRNAARLVARDLAADFARACREVYAYAAFAEHFAAANPPLAERLDARGTRVVAAAAELLRLARRLGGDASVPADEAHMVADAPRVAARTWAIETHSRWTMRIGQLRRIRRDDLADRLVELLAAESAGPNLSDMVCRGER